MACRHDMAVSVLMEIEATDLFRDENVNWRYCKAHATFSHKEACEFVLHIGDEDEYMQSKIDEMLEFGCTIEFVRCYEKAAKMGATRVLFWA
jgi:hypothetical protein